VKETIIRSIKEKNYERGGLPAFDDKDKLMNKLSDRSMVKIGG